MAMLARLKAYDPHHGYVLRRYTTSGIQFDAGAGWYRVDDRLAAHLATVHEVPDDAKTPLAFEVVSAEEAARLDRETLLMAEREAVAESATFLRGGRGGGPVVGRTGSAEQPFEKVPPATAVAPPKPEPPTTSSPATDPDPTHRKPGRRGSKQWGVTDADASEAAGAVTDPAADTSQS